MGTSKLSPLSLPGGTTLWTGCSIIQRFPNNIQYSSSSNLQVLDRINFLVAQLLITMAFPKWLLTGEGRPPPINLKSLEVNIATNLFQTLKKIFCFFNIKALHYLLMFVCPTVFFNNFYGCCQPCFVEQWIIRTYIFYV